MQTMIGDGELSAATPSLLVGSFEILPFSLISVLIDLLFDVF